MKNTLVQYQGGGYDGCIWEWNYFFLDANGKFHNVFNSGQNGIETAEQAKEFMNRKPESEIIFKYDMADENAIKEFSKECNAVNIAGVLQWFDENPQLGVEFFAVCSACGYPIAEYSELHLENWHGCGGIQSTAGLLLCCECYANGVCGCCDEYVGGDDLTYLGGEYNFDDEYINKAAKKMFDDGYSDVCEGCLGCQAEQIAQDEQEDLLWQALTTGKPDLFSDKMRWLWNAD